MTVCSLPRCFFSEMLFNPCFMQVSCVFVTDEYHVPPRGCSGVGGFFCLSLHFCQGKLESSFSVLCLNPPGVHWSKAGACWCLVRPGSVPSVSFEEKRCRESKAGVLPSNLNFYLEHSCETIFLEKLLGWQIPLSSLFGNSTITNKPFCSRLRLSDLYHTYLSSCQA